MSLFNLTWKVASHVAVGVCIGVTGCVYGIPLTFINGLDGREFVKPARSFRWFQLKDTSVDAASPKDSWSDRDLHR